MEMETLKGKCLDACRVCTNSENTSFVDLFESPDELENEIEFILSQLNFWNIKIARNDGMSQLICVDCLTKFCSIAVFRKECLDAQEQFLQTANTEIPLAKEHYEADVHLSDEYESAGTTESSDHHGMEDISPPQMSSVEVNLNSIIAQERNNPTENEVNGNQQLVSQRSINGNALILFNEPDVGMVKQSGLSKEVCSDDIEDILQGNIIIKNSTDCNKENMSMQESERGIDEANSDGCNYSDGDGLDDVALLTGNLLACQYCYCSVDKSNDYLVFPDAEALSQHLLTVHDPSQPFTCPYCNLTYKSIKLRDNHVQFHHNRIRQSDKCVYCRKVLRSSVETHENNSCGFIGDWECEVCALKLIQKPLHRFRTHQRSHMLDQKLQCKICERFFVRRSTFLAHLKTHSTPKQAVFYCDTCGNGFRSEYEFKRHNYQVHNGDFPVNCNYCHKGFVSNAFLHRHLENFHPETVDSVKCSNCGAQFSSILKLRFHLQRPRDENGKCISTTGVLREKRSEFRRNNFQCSYCSKYFYNRIQLDNHLVSHDPNERPFQCEHCNLRCRSLSELQQHTTLTHAKTFKCELCKKCFAYKKDLRDHMLYHTELSLYCAESDCTFTCKNKKTLNDHVRQKHDHIPCEYCGSTFIRENLIKHLNDVHRAEIDVVLSEAPMNESADSSIKEIVPLETQSKVLVEYVHEKANGTSNMVSDQASNSFAEIDAGEHQFTAFFMSNLLDPENEIIVT